MYLFYILLNIMLLILLNGVKFMSQGIVRLLKSLQALFIGALSKILVLGQPSYRKLNVALIQDAGLKIVY